MKSKASLLSRFAASFAALAVTAVVLATLFFALVSGRIIRLYVEHTLHHYSRLLAEKLLASSNPDDWPRVARDNRVWVLIETPQARRAFDADGADVAPEDLPGSDQGFFRIDVGGDGGEQVTFAWDLRRFRGGHWHLLGGYVVILVTVIGAGYAFQRRQLRPLQWLRTGVEAVTRGDFQTKVPVVRQDEIGQVAGAFNQMTRRVERMIADRERLLADVSHELRSPLARVKVALELLPEGEKRSSIQRDVREMETLISVLLEREHLRSRSLKAEPVDLTAVVSRVAESFAGRPPGVTFEAPDEPLVAEADADLIRLLAQNLIDNAVKFSRPDSRPVEVTLRQDGDAVELRVADDGPGIPEEAAERIFEPFVKLDPARGHRSGYGLGLNLCWRIVEVHGGSIEMRPGCDGGTCARVLLPRTRAA